MDKLEKLKDDESTSFITELNINGTQVYVYLDDYGQQYFFQYIDKEGNLQEEGCGSYNLCWLEYIYNSLDRYNSEISLYGWDVFNEETERLEQLYKDRIKKYAGDDEGIQYIQEWYKHTVFPRKCIDQDKVIYYNFNEIYDSIYEKLNKNKEEM